MDRLMQHCEERLWRLYQPEERNWASRRLHLELATIQKSGQCQAFEDAGRSVQILRDQGKYCRLVGAGCSSLVSYLMGISEIDPIAHGLSFERFLEANSSRTTHFDFVADLKTDWDGAEGASIQNQLSNDSVRVKQATSIELIPSIVAKEVHQKRPDFGLASIPLNDERTFEVLRLGQVGGIRQIEGPNEVRLLRDIKPRCLTNLGVIKAILVADDDEPGMLDEFIHQRSKRHQFMSKERQVSEVLDETRGIILFQEQIMLILNRVADIPMADAYSFIKSVCKRNWERVGTFREWFVVGAVGNGMNQSDAFSLFEEIRNAATRAVCKAHHLSEALATYQTAFLKTHFSREFYQTIQLVHQ